MILGRFSTISFIILVIFSGFIGIRNKIDRISFSLSRVLDLRILRLLLARFNPTYMYVDPPLGFDQVGRYKAWFFIFRITFSIAFLIGIPLRIHLY